MRTGITFCSIYLFINAIPQGRTEKLRFDSSIELGSNVTQILDKMNTLLYALKNYTVGQGSPLPNLGTPPPIDAEMLLKLKGHIMELLSGKIQLPVTPTYEEKKVVDPNEQWSNFWDAIKEVMNDVAKSIVRDTNSQAIVQEARTERQYSLLQKIKSGRIRGPVHVYGRHSGSKERNYNDD